ncbi:MAG: SH3 domain-containing protein, partial [Halobacteriovoraceae bacterium]|nr:SH3 domain-containing protein [Halobacteriovoraceae bacterium]
MYFVEVVKKLKVAVAMVALSAMIPQLGMVKAESPAVAVISKESLERRLAAVVLQSARMEELELQFIAWSESTKPKEGEDPSEAHKKISADLAEVQKQKRNLNNFIGFLNRKIKNHMSAGELAIADGFMTNVETALENLNLPELPEGTPGVSPIITEKIEVRPLPPIAATEEEKREFERRAQENDAALILPEGGGDDKVTETLVREETVVVAAPVEEEKKVVVAEDEASRRARIAADVAARLKLMEETGAGIAPVDDSLMYNGRPIDRDVVAAETVVEKAIVREPSERNDDRQLVTTTTVEGGDDKIVAAPVVIEDEKVVAAPVVTEDEKVVAAPVVTEDEKIVVAPTDTVVEKTEEFSMTVTEPRADGTERVIAKNNLGVGFNPEKVQYVELNCAGALIVKREANGASASIDDISCKNDKNRPTKVLILGFKDGHYKVFVNGFIGWISAVKTSEPKEVGEVDEEDTTIVIKPQDGQLNCDSRLMHRTGPTTEYRILQKIPCKTGGRPTPVKIIGKHNQTGWYLVSHNGTIAWSSNRYINATEPNNLQIVTNDLLQGLSQVPDLGDLGIKCD